MWTETFLLYKLDLVKAEEPEISCQHPGPYNENYSFSSSHVWAWEMNNKKGWALKNWYLWTVVLEKTLESPVDCQEIKWVSPKGNNPEYSLEGLMLKLMLQYFGHLMRRVNSLKKTDAVKDPDTGKDWGQEERWTAEDEIVEWHHWLNGCEFEQIPGDYREAWCAAAREVPKRWAWLSNWTTTV